MVLNYFLLTVDISSFSVFVQNVIFYSKTFVLLKLFSVEQFFLASAFPLEVCFEDTCIIFGRYLDSHPGSVSSWQPHSSDVIYCNFKGNLWDIYPH